MPDSSLLTENIIVQLFGPKIGWTEFDLRKYKLVFDQNIVVSLQWIGHSKRGRMLQMPISMPSPGAVHFYKFGSQSNWKRFNAMSTAMSLEVGVEEVNFSGSKMPATVIASISESGLCLLLVLPLELCSILL